MSHHGDGSDGDDRVDRRRVRTGRDTGAGGSESGEDDDTGGQGRRLTSRPELSESFEERSDIAKRFGAEIDVTGPAPDEKGFFLVKRRPDVDPDEFRPWLLGSVGGEEQLLLETPSGIYIVWTTFETAEAVREDPTVALVGGVSVDLKRLREMLSLPG